MRSMIALTTVLLLTAGPVFAQSAEDSAYDKRGSSVIDTRGNCVRTKWMGENDPCAPDVAPTPAPVAQPAPTPAPMPVVTLEQRTVYFDFDSAALTADGTAKLNQLVDLIDNSTSVDGLVIHGYTDQFGADSYNSALAQRRAAAVKTYLDTHSKLNTSVGEVLGLGKASPTDGCGAEKNRAKRIACMASERRVEIEIKAEK